MLMEVCEGRPPPSLVDRRRRWFRSSPLTFERFLNPCKWHQIPFRNGVKIDHHVGLHNCLLKPSPAISANKDASYQELCKVLWTVEADLVDGQLLYITGDPITLGCWEPQMAVPLFPSNENAKLWKTEVKVPCGTNFKYSYFMKSDKWPSCDLIWRPGPEFSVSVPLREKQNKKIVVRDSWLTHQPERLPVQAWGSWIEETFLIANPVTSVVSGDDIRNCRNRKSDSVDLKASPVDESYSSVEDNIKVFNVSKELNETDQPVEEPWLLQSSKYILQFKANLQVPEKDSDSDVLKEIVYPDKSDQGTEDLDEGRKVTIYESVSTVILINSSMCTMQRIAILEDGKLVELLLEPVKDTVHCDSVYLGVITQLVPQMGGALVNIGSSKSSLMDIKHMREPFVFPPFRRESTGKKVNGSPAKKQKEHSDTRGNELVQRHGSSDIFDGSTGPGFEDDLAQRGHEYYDEEHDIDDDVHVPDIMRKTMNGSAVDYGGGEADFDELDANGYHLEGETETANDLKDSVDANGNDNKWAHVRKGTKVIVQVTKEGLGKKGPVVTAYPVLRSRFWVLRSRSNNIMVSKKISGAERPRLKAIAESLRPPGFGLTVRTVAAGHSLEELQKDLNGLLSTWKNIMENAKSAALAADEGVEGAIPVILHRAMGQTLSVAQDYFNDKVKNMVVDSPRTYHEITNYLQEIAPDLCDRVELYKKRTPIFDEYGIEEEINNMLSKSVSIAKGGSLVIEQTEALVSIDVNGGHGMFRQGASQEEAILDVNLTAAKQIAKELRLRDIGGLIVVDFIDMADDSNKRLVYEEMKKSVARDRSQVRVSELSRYGLMEMTRKRVRPSVTFMISEPCPICHATGRIEALETSFSKIEHEICRLLAKSDQKTDLKNPKSWPRFIMKVDRFMCNYLTTGKRTRLALLSSSLKVWILLKVARGFSRGAFEVTPYIDDKENDNQQQVAEVGRKKLHLFPVKEWKSSPR